MKKTVCFGLSLLAFCAGARAEEFSFPAEIESAAVCHPTKTEGSCTIKNCYISNIYLTCIDESGAELFANRKIFEKVVDDYDFNNENYRQLEFMRLVLAMRAKGFRLEDSFFVKKAAL